MITLELPQTPRTVVMAPPMAWRPSEAYARTVVRTLASLPWVRPTSLSALLAAAPSDVTRTLAPYPESAANAQLPSTYVARIAATEREAATLAEIVGGASDGTGAVVGALQRSGSAFWRAERRTGDALLTRTTAGVDELTAKVRVVSSGSVSLPGETGTIPVTIANDLEVPVTVGLRVTGDPAVRLEASPVAPITIAPGRKTSVEVTARVAGSGSVTALLQLTTPSGQDYGEPARIEVGSAAYARAAAWVVGAAFALLLALVAVNTVRRVRVARVARRRAAAEDPDDGSMTP